MKQENWGRQYTDSTATVQNVRRSFIFKFLQFCLFTQLAHKPSQVQ